MQGTARVLQEDDSRVGVYFAEFDALFRRARFRLRSDLFGDLVSRPLLLLVSIRLLPPLRHLPSVPLPVRLPFLP